MTFFSDGGFDANNVEPQTAFQPLPDGEYPVMIVKAEEKQTSTGGLQLVLTYQVVDGQKYAKRKLFHRINLRNKNPVCVEIGMKELSGVCHAIGVLKPKTAAEFCGKQLTVKVGHEEYNGEIRNKINGVVLKQDTPQRPAVNPAPQQSNDNPAPWG